MRAIQSISIQSKRQPGRWLRVLTIILTIGFVLVTAGALFLYLYGQVDQSAPADAIIILGGSLNPDGSPTAAEFRRVMHGITLYKRGLAAKLICTGGQAPDRPRSEASVCVDLLESNGIPAESILREDTSRDTQQNIIEAQAVMAQNSLHTALIVSDNYHLFRARWLAYIYGLSASFSPAQSSQGPMPLDEAVISSYREVGALLWNMIRIGLGLR